MPTRHWIVATGNPSDGFTYYGPFTSPDAAGTWGEDNRDQFPEDGYWVINLEVPA